MRSRGLADVVTPSTHAEAPRTRTALAPAVNAAVSVEGRSLLELVWSKIRRSAAAMASLVVIVLLILMTLFAPALAKIEGQDPDRPHTSAEYLTQGTVLYRDDGRPAEASLPGIPRAEFRQPSADHWLGIAPNNGFDIFARLVYGGRVSLGIALASTLVSVILGTIFGVLAGYLGGTVDMIVSRTVDLLLAFPVILFAIALTPILASRFSGDIADSPLLPIMTLFIVLGFFGAPYLERMVRGTTVSMREREFVEAAHSLGASTGRILFREIAPNVVPVVLVYVTIAIPTNILAEAALSFIGIGVRQPMSSWGEMLNQAIKYTAVYPWFFLVPGVILLISVLAFNLLGDAVGDALDPRAART
jgi:peptide/nickel transport system permease protein